MTTQDEPSKPPYERLAAEVAKSLRDRGFITADQVDDVTRKVASGTAGTADWRLWIEIAREKQQNERHDGSPTASAD